MLCVVGKFFPLPEPQFPYMSCRNDNAFLLRFSRGCSEGLAPHQAHKCVRSVAAVIINNKDILGSAFSPNLGVIHLLSPSPPASSSPWQDLPTTPSFLPLHSCLWQFPLPGPPSPSALPTHVSTSTRGDFLQDVLPDQPSSLCHSGIPVTEVSLCHSQSGPCQ